MPDVCRHVRTAVQEAISDDQIRKISAPICTTCKEHGSNFWLCLYPGCNVIACGDADGGQDHSTAHFQAFPTHTVQMNVTTIRAWCYHCNREVGASILDDIRRQLTKMLNPKGDSNFGEPIRPNNDNAEYVAKASDPIKSNPMNDEHMEEEARGLVGLANLGNTCYMNSALQCLSNIPALTEFFLTCSPLVTKADVFNCVQRDKPSLSQSYLMLLKDLWASNRGSNAYVAPTKLLFAFKASHPMFRGYHQQDSQEFLRCFMDQIHEELMEPENELNQEEEEAMETEDAGSNPEGSSSNLMSVSERASSTSQDENEEPEEEEDYETADSGVSENSSSSKSDDQSQETEVVQEPSQSTTTSTASSTRKRKYQSCSFTGDSVPSSDGETEFLDAASSRSASPPAGGSGTMKMTPRSPNKVNPGASSSNMLKRKHKTYRSVITDVFDGKLNSSVQCLTCDRVSTTTETFQDLSLPIPSQEALANSRGLGKLTVPPSSAASSTTSLVSETNSGWFSWIWSWMSEWFYGPDISLHDCLAYFFSADELKGDNMYSCEKCKKLRNGLKYSRVTILPDTLCIHLKRFRHEFAFSSKISSKVTFPLIDLDMRPWLHQDCISGESRYDLVGVICHHGTAGGGHYTAYSLNNNDQEWYEYDDSYVSKVEAATVMNAEAYVLFYRKNNLRIEPLREEVQTYLDQGSSLVQFYISRQWLNKFENFAEPGPIDNSDFLCQHGGVLPAKAEHVYELCVAFPQSAWNFLRSTFGGGPACSRLYECSHCREKLEALNRQKTYELETFKQLHAEFQESDSNVMNCLSSTWFKQWEQFVLGRQRDPPGPIDNASIITFRINDRVPILRPSADFIRLSYDMWKMFLTIYGGGPEVILRSNGTSLVVMYKPNNPSNSQTTSTKNRLRSTSESTISTTVSSSSTSKI